MVAGDVVIIGWRTQTSLETRPWTVDWTLGEDSGDAIASVTATLTDLLNGSDYPDGLLGAATFAGVTATATVTALLPGRNYRLEWVANMGGSKESSVVLLLACPF